MPGPESSADRGMSREARNAPENLTESQWDNHDQQGDRYNPQHATHGRLQRWTACRNQRIGAIPVAVIARCGQAECENAPVMKLGRELPSDLEERPVKCREV